jgi:hypothetical protein
MSNHSEDQLLLDLLLELLDSWDADDDPKVISHYPERIDLLNRFRTTFQGDPPDSVRQLYKKVYLRDVWGQQSNH